MSTRRERVGLVLLGVFLGLVIAASFLWWQDKMIRKEWFSYKGVASLIHSLFDRKDDVLTLQDGKKMQEGWQGKTGKIGVTSPDSADAILDSLLMYDTAGNSYISENDAFEYYIESGDPDSLRYHHPGLPAKPPFDDTLFSDTSHRTFTGKSEDELVVKRDRFIRSRLYPVADYPDSLLRTAGKIDSLLSGDKRTRRLPGKMLRIEFWNSPINFSGYKLSENRMILFGNFNPDDIALEYRSNQLYMRYRNKSYPLDMTDEFQSLVNPGKQ